MGRTSIIKITSQITSGNKSTASGRPQPQKLDEKGVSRRRLTSAALCTNESHVWIRSPSQHAQVLGHTHTKRLQHLRILLQAAHQKVRRRLPAVYFDQPQSYHSEAAAVLQWKHGITCRVASPLGLPAGKHKLLQFLAISTCSSVHLTPNPRKPTPISGEQRGGHLL